jgi:hypothetical protein
LCAAPLARQPRIRAHTFSRASPYRGQRPDRGEVQSREAKEGQGVPQTEQAGERTCGHPPTSLSEHSDERGVSYE